MFINLKKKKNIGLNFLDYKYSHQEMRATFIIENYSLSMSTLHFTLMIKGPLLKILDLKFNILAIHKQIILKQIVLV